MSLQHPRRALWLVEGGSRLPRGKGVIPIFMTFPAAADSCLYALCPNKLFKHWFGLKAARKGKASLNMVRKFKIARFPE